MILFFFFNATTTTEIYTLSLHDALPICEAKRMANPPAARPPRHENHHMQAEDAELEQFRRGVNCARSEEHTSELQSPDHLVCRLLLEKKKKHSTSRRQQSTPQPQDGDHV